MERTSSKKSEPAIALASASCCSAERATKGSLAAAVEVGDAVVDDLRLRRVLLGGLVELARHARVDRIGQCDVRVQGASECRHRFGDVLLERQRRVSAHPTCPFRVVSLLRDDPIPAGAARGDRMSCVGARQRYAPWHHECDSFVSWRYAPWHFLNFLPDPHQQGSLRPICSTSATRRCWTGSGSGAASSGAPAASASALGWAVPEPPE